MILEVKFFPTDITLLALKQVAMLISCNSITAVNSDFPISAKVSVTMTLSVEQYHLQGCWETAGAMDPLF